MASVWNTARLYFEAVRYQSSRQLLGRARYAASFALYAALFRAGGQRLIEQGCEMASAGVSPRPDFRWPEAGAGLEGGYLGEGVFRFQGRRVEFGDRIDWNPAGLPLLWRFHLNYFDWAPRLAAAGRWEELDAQVRGWIAANPPGRRPAWHPYPLSLRIGAWIRSLTLAPAGVETLHWHVSLRRQAAFLTAHPEYHLGGNHLLENAFALLAAGLFFSGSRAAEWRRRGLNLLLEELDRQVLPDGGHVERSFSYHFRVTLLCREAANLLRANLGGIPAALKDAEQRLARYLDALLHEDGNIPLFQDSELIEDQAWKRFHRLAQAAR